MADVAVGGFSSAYSTAVNGDTLELLPGEHITPGNWATNQRQTIAKQLIIKSKDWNATTTPGKYVTSGVGHNLTEYATVWRGGWATTTGANSTIFRGIAFDGRMSGGGGFFDLNSDDIVFEDCYFTDGRRYIGVHVGGTRICQRVIFRRCRFRMIGDRAGHDHPIYWKNANNGVVEDCVFYDNAGWTQHCYTNCDNLIVRRTVGDRNNGFATFSGDTGNTIDGNYQYSTGNAIEDSIMTNAQGGLVGSDDTQTPRYLAEYWYASTAGTNYVRRTVAWNSSIPSGSGVLGTIQSGSQIQQTSIINSNPLYTDPLNGDFRLPSNSPALGKGPTYIQPGGAPPEPTPPVTGLSTGTITSSSVVLNWTNPSGAVTTMIRRSTTEFPATTSDGTELYNSTAKTTHTDSGLTDTTTYYYSVFNISSGGVASNPTSIAAVTGGGTPPPPTDPTNGAEYSGTITIGSVWRPMSADYKRASVFTIPSARQITSFGIYARNTGSTPQTVRLFAYDNATGALLGVSVSQAISNGQAPEWLSFPLPGNAFDGPSPGGTIRIGVHSSDGTAEIAASVVTGALVHGVDTYADGTDATWISPGTDNYQLSIYAITLGQPSSNVLAGTGSSQFVASGNLTEVTPGSTGITDVVYRMVEAVKTYTVPTPFQVSTDAELEWDGTKFIYKED